MLQKFIILSLMFALYFIPGWSQVSMDNIDVATNENFDGLENSSEGAISDPALLPTGWLVFEDFNERYVVSDGNETSNAIYSYGPDGTTERALGSYRKFNSSDLYFGASFQNNTGVDVNWIEISFVVELWRSAFDDSDSLVLEYSLDATSLYDGTWFTIQSGSVVPPNYGSEDPVDGNHFSNQVNVSLIYPIQLSTGQTFFIRWRDDNLSNDAGMAIDFFSITPREEVHFYDNGLDYTYIGNWGSNEDGSGAMPYDFQTPNQYFHFRNNVFNLMTPWNISDGVDTNIIVVSNANFAVTEPNIVAKYILLEGTITALFGIENFYIEDAHPLSVIEYFAAGGPPTKLNLRNPGMLFLHSTNADEFILDADINVQTTFTSHATLYVPKEFRITGPLNLISSAVVSIERQKSVAFGSIDIASTVHYSGVEGDIADTIKNYDYGILKIEGSINHILSENINVATYTEIYDNNVFSGSGGFDFNGFKITGTGDFYAHQNATLLIRDSLGVAGSFNSTGTKHIYEDVQIGYIGPNVKYSGNPFLDDDKLIAIGNAGPGDLKLTEDFGVSGGINAYTGDIDLNGHIVYLDPTANVYEDPGYYIKGNSGYLELTTTFGTTANNPSLLGLDISAVSNLGLTTIRRGHAIQTGLGNESIRRYFDIIPANNTALDATLRMYYVDLPYYRNGLDENQFEFFRSTDNGLTWTEKQLSTVDVVQNFVELTNIPAFSRWTIGSRTSPMPIELLDLNIDCKNKQLKWTTATETNNDHFIIEKSNDAIHYALYKSISGAGNSTQLQNYSVNIDQEKIYYRLSQVDYDGNKEISGILFNNCQTEDFSVWHSDSEPGTIHFSDLQEGNLFITIYDMNGKAVSSVSCAVDGGEIKIPTRNLAKGIYFVQAENNDRIKIVKIIL